MKKGILVSIGFAVILVVGMGLGRFIIPSTEMSMQGVYSGVNASIEPNVAIERVSLQFMKEMGDCPKAASRKVLQVLLSVPGVMKVSVDPSQLLADITHQKGIVPILALRGAIEEAGFTTL